MGFSFNAEPDFWGEYITVRTAAEISGYDQQYLRKLLRGNILKSRRFGQAWLIERRGLIGYLNHARRSADKRFGPHVEHRLATDS